MKESEFYELMEKIEQGGVDVLPKPMQCIQPSVEQDCYRRVMRLQKGKVVLCDNQC